MNYLFVAAFLVGCQHATVDRSLDAKAETVFGTVGVDDDHQLIIQREEDISAVLRNQLWTNASLEEETRFEQHRFDDCRQYLSDPRLGGYNFVKDLASPEPLKPAVDEQMGVTEDGQVKVVRRQGLKEKLTYEQKRENGIRQHLGQLRKTVATCQKRLRSARLRHGLPAEKYQPQGYYTSEGVWVTTVSGERTLDDAFAIRAKNAAGARKR